MIDKRKLAVALAVLAVVIGVAIALALVGPDETERSVRTETPAAEQEREVVQDLCASRETFQGLKKLVFDAAARIRTGERINFDVLAATAFPRMENPVVASRDESLGITACTGRFILELPPGAERAFNGARRLVADVRYEVQPAADGSGLVYRMTGADGIVSQLAAFELEGEPLTLPDDVLDTAVEEADGSITAPEDREVYPGFPPPTPQPGRNTPPVGEWSNPSFDCRTARTRSEVMICGSDGLARRDRRMVEMFNDAMTQADPRTRQILLRTRDSFIAYRERCRSNDCVEEGYEDRMDEIRDIMREAN